MGIQRGASDRSGWRLLAYSNADQASCLTPWGNCHWQDSLMLLAKLVEAEIRG